MGLRLLAFLLALSLGGALWLGYSLAHAARGQGTIGDTPRTVLVAIAGNAVHPGFAGFLVHINPNSRVIHIMPVPGSVKTALGVSLNVAESSETGAELAALVGQAAHDPLSGYFVIQLAAVQEVLTNLDLHAPGWPHGLTPSTSLKALGWYTHPKPKAILRLFKAILTGLPELRNQADLQQTVVSNSATNLSAYQMYLLGSYIRGVPLRTVPWGKARESRRR